MTKVEGTEIEIKEFRAEKAKEVDVRAKAKIQEIATSLKRSGVSIDEIAEITEMSEEEILML